MDSWLFLIRLSKKTTQTEIYFETVIGSKEENIDYCKGKAYTLMIIGDILKMNLNHLRVNDQVFRKTL